MKTWASEYKTELKRGSSFLWEKLSPSAGAQGRGMAFLGTLPMPTIRNCSSQVAIKYSMKTNYPPGAKCWNEAGGENLAKLTPVKV